MTNKDKTVLERWREACSFLPADAVLERDVLSELEQYDTLFELQRKADQRAVKRWKKAHPDRDLIHPDRADMVVWLMEQYDEQQRLLALLRGEHEPEVHRIEHDGFEGNIVGGYVTREGKRGVVLQQVGTRVVHVYGEKWLK